MLRTVIAITMALAAMMCASQVAELRVSAPVDNLRFQQLDAWRTESHVDETVAPGEEGREEFHKTLPLTESGRVSLENINGNVRIGAWDRQEVQVDAVKRATTKERLSEASIDVNATPDTVIIKTIYAHSKREDKRRHEGAVSVDYTLSIPRKARLESVDLVNGSLDIDGVEGSVKGSSVNGRVTASGLMAEARLSTVNGNLEAVFAQLESESAINLGSVNGGVLLIIPSDTNATIRANTVHGAIENDFGLGVEQGKYAGSELYGQLGSGEARVKIGNVNGSITIKHAQDGRKLSSATCLLPQKDKDKSGKKDEGDEVNEETQRLAEEAKDEALANIDEEKMKAEIAAETQREVEQAIREAHREIERAQREVEREVQRETRQQLREQRKYRADEDGGGSGKDSEEGAGSKHLIERESKTFTVTGRANLNIRTYDGNVTLRGWDKPQVTFTTTKRGTDREELGEIQVQATQEGPTISIVAISESGNGSADLEVFVPRSTTVNASTDDGAMSVEGVSGDLILRTGDGSIEASGGNGHLEANTGDGGIQIKDFQGQVKARTGDGDITLDGTFNALAADTGSGSITLSVPADARFTIESNAENFSSQGLEVTEDHSPSRRVRRWRVSGGGSLFVLRTGDGSVLLRRR